MWTVLMIIQVSLVLQCILMEKLCFIKLRLDVCYCRFVLCVSVLGCESSTWTCRQVSCGIGIILQHIYPPCKSSYTQSISNSFYPLTILPIIHPPIYPSANPSVCSLTHSHPFIGELINSPTNECSLLAIFEEIQTRFGPKQLVRRPAGMCDLDISDPVCFCTGSSVGLTSVATPSTSTHYTTTSSPAAGGSTQSYRYHLLVAGASCGPRRCLRVW